MLKLNKTDAALYAISFPNGKKYIGISNRPFVRFNDHLRAAANGKKLPIYNAMRSFGIDSVALKILCIGSRSDMNELEVKAIAAWNTRVPHGYNTAHGGQLSPATIPEIAMKIGAALKGKKLSPEHAAKSRIAAAKGRANRVYKPLTPEQCLAMSVARLGVKPSPETVAKAQATRRGYKHSEETKQKISASHFGKTHTPETRAKLRLSSLGVVPTLETRAKMSKANAGRTLTPEQRLHRLNYCLPKAWAAFRSKYSTPLPS